MRISFLYKASYNKAILENAASNKMDALKRAASGQRIIKPEDAPDKYSTAYSIQRMIDDADQFIKNSEYVNNWLNESERNIKELQKILIKAREIAIKSANSGISSTETSQEIEGLLAEVRSIANAQYMGRYLFGGYQTMSKPFYTDPNNINNYARLYGTDGVEIYARDKYNDMPEISSGEYVVEVIFKGDTGYLSLFDKTGKRVLIDSNGTDDTTRGGNSISTELIFKAEPGAIVNTGVGVSVKLPLDISSGSSFRYQLNYQAGSGAAYLGDNGIIKGKLNVTNDVAMNFTGRELFLRSLRQLQSTKINTVNGTSLSPSSKFSDIDMANARPGDSITLSGIDHNGLPVGVAKSSGTEAAKLDLTNATDKERTLIFGYAGNYYQVIIPADSYSSIDEMSYTFNRLLKNAQYLGPQALVTKYDDIDMLRQIQNNEINNVLIPSALSINQIVDLSSEINVRFDGDRLAFNTTGTGDHTILSVTGYKHNLLGFDDKTVAGIGKDMVFEIGTDYKIDGIYTLSTQHKAVDLSSVSTLMIINGEYISIDNLNTATTNLEREGIINKALREKFGFDITVKVQDTTPATLPMTYDLTFVMQNVNYVRDTRLSTAVGTPALWDYQMSAPYKGASAYVKEKTIGDFINFIEGLYDESVVVELENGRLSVYDTRSGESKLNLNIRANNEGVSLPLASDDIIVAGKYNGIDNLWHTNLRVEHNVDGSKKVTVNIVDEKGKIIMNEVFDNYIGGYIALPNGLKMVVPPLNTSTTNPIAATNFDLIVKTGATLSFGDMNVVEQGGNQNFFIMMENLFEAIRNQVPDIKDTPNDKGASAPDAWSNSDFKSTSKPYIDGRFGGNYNATWKFENISTDGQTNYFIQEEFKTSLSKFKYMPGATVLNYEIDVYDSKTGVSSKYPVAVDLTNVSDDASLIQAITDSVNKDQLLFSKKISAEIKNGSIVFSSGSGTGNINVIATDQSSIYMMGIVGNNTISFKESSIVSSTFDVQYFDGLAWQTATIIVDPYLDQDAMLTQINSALTTATTGITAGITNGKLSFSSTSPFYISSAASPDGSFTLDNRFLTSFAADKDPYLMLANSSIDERTFTFNYNTLSGAETVSITLDPSDYSDTKSFVSAINAKLTAINANTNITAAFEAGRLVFKPSANISALSVQNGDYDGKLGFPKTGTVATIRVTDQRGRNIQNIEVDTANVEHPVADGLTVGFDKGSIGATDSFNTLVGTGPKYELGVLDMVENQITQAITLVGNRGSRVESIIKYHSLTKLELTTVLHKELGADDLATLAMEKTNAEQAYEIAIALVGTTLGKSLLDFLR